MTTKGLAKWLRGGLEGLVLVNPMHPMLKGLQGLKKGKKKPALGGSRLVDTDFMSQDAVMLGIVLQGQSESMLH